MKRFYTKSDLRKSLKKLYQIESIDDYKKLISKTKIDFQSLQKIDTVHGDYAHFNDYITKLIIQSKRIIFLSVNDLTKEAYYLNKFPEKEFIVGDVSTVAIKKSENFWTNVKVIQTTHKEFSGGEDDLIIINIGEYFLNQEELNSFLQNSRHIIFNNVLLYEENMFNWLDSLYVEIRSLTVNLLSLFCSLRQQQFRGWYRNYNDFLSVTSGTNKVLKSVKYRPGRTAYHRNLFCLKIGMVHYEKKTEVSSDTSIPL